MKSMFKRSFLALLCTLAAASLQAEPWLHAGDTLLRHDVSILADAGVIRTPITTWPLSVASVDADLRAFKTMASLGDKEQMSFHRLRARINHEKVTYQMNPKIKGAASRQVPVIRNYENIARSDLQIGASADLLTDRFAFRLEASLLDNASDQKNVRFDGSYLAGIFKNTIVSAGYIDRWWGPGWNGSLIYSNNARPIPGVSLQRNFVSPFANRWLSWMGPWNYMITAGRLESNRTIPNPYHFGMRLTFKPRSNLEIGMTRTAQWGGEGRPTDSDSFLNLLFGQDNVSSDGLTRETEPGNQLAGFDVRWNQKLLPFDLSLYSQAIGEDEAGGFPSRYMGLVGFEHTRSVYNRSLRVSLEYADTACDFLESSPKLNCAYNHGIYNDGYRYLGEAIGHPIDGDSRALSLSAVLSNDSAVDWQMQLHKLNINRAPDATHSISLEPSDGFQFDLARTAQMPWGKIRVNLGYQHFDSELEKDNGLLLGIQFSHNYQFN